VFDLQCLPDAAPVGVAAVVLDFRELRRRRPTAVDVQHDGRDGPREDHHDSDQQDDDDRRCPLVGLESPCSPRFIV
jgi:hypothetical protein